MRILVTEGKADVNQAENDGYIPLYFAAFNGDAAVVRFLFSEGTADVNKAPTMVYSMVGPRCCRGRRQRRGRASRGAGPGG